MARGHKQVPKKKHVNKERQAPIVVLSELDRTFFAYEAEQKAKIHLNEAMAIAAWGKAPNAAFHSAYYSMYFCAIAALYRSGGVGKSKGVPGSHEHVIQHYILLAESIDDDFIKTSGTLLNRARDERIRADYFVGVDQEVGFGVQGESSGEASEAAEVAARFLQAWTDRRKA